MFSHGLRDSFFKIQPDKEKTQALHDAMIAFDTPEELAEAMHIIGGGCMTSQDHRAFFHRFIKLSSKYESCKEAIDGIWGG